MTTNKDTMTPLPAATINHMNFMLDDIRWAWRQQPEQRLGQLIANATRFDDLFYLSDEDLIAQLKAQVPA